MRVFEACYAVFWLFVVTALCFLVWAVSAVFGAAVFLLCGVSSDLGRRFCHSLHVWWVRVRPKVCAGLLGLNARGGESGTRLPCGGKVCWLVVVSVFLINIIAETRAKCKSLMHCMIATCIVQARYHAVSDCWLLFLAFAMGSWWQIISLCTPIVIEV